MNQYASIGKNQKDRWNPPGGSKAVSPLLPPWVGDEGHCYLQAKKIIQAIYMSLF
jgi:hypothetical protein